MKNNFSIIIYLDKKLNQKVRNIQEELSNLTGSKACLDLWKPHFTIGAGVGVEDKKLNSLYKEIKENLKEIKQFKIKIKDYGFMNNWMSGKLKGFTKYVVYLNIMKNKELQKLFNILKRNITDKREIFYGPISNYNPHITLAFKDLDYKGFLKAKKFLKNKKFEDELTINHIALAKENSNESWSEYKRFKLK
ncbi:MAG: hypothetical protein QT10_C0011G0032 [archaeon GW2011_AR19]|nr:MAG: hypothetical protein QT10_C0011G0032 [archaeon GW2011_AR19]